MEKQIADGSLQSMLINNLNIIGLNNQQVLQARSKFGYNRLIFKKQNRLIDVIKGVVKEPMVILLFVASSIYFISGNIGDGIFLASAIVFVSAISLYQDSRSRNAIGKLKEFTQPMARVIRNGETVEIKNEELVIGDSLVMEEGRAISADGKIVHSNDFSVNESILTGESLSVYKDSTEDNNLIFQGTTVVSGLAIATITEVGSETKLGKIGSSLDNITEEKTALEVQINNFVKKMVIVGTIVFFTVWIINYFSSHHVLDSLLKALTLAMSILPEEIPVAFTTFMALGAWRLMKMGIIVKQMKTVETLGSATVICIDKTGTITENTMSLAKIYINATQSICNADNLFPASGIELIRMAMWASEPIPFDPMESALHESYTKINPVDERPLYRMKHEYPLAGKPPMMTHIFEDDSGNCIIAAKGAPEAIMALSCLTDAEKLRADTALKILTSDGYRVLGVGEATFTGSDYPKTQQEFRFHFMGIVAFYDPPKKNISMVLEDFYRAGIAVKILTGDNAATTTAVARQVGFKGFEKNISGDDLMKLSEADLEKAVEQVFVFSRMFPEAKLKIVNALKINHEIVAMTGDGVNDGPALKSAHIGIAMGRKGTEIAKQAASLILIEDDLSKMVDAVAIGRKIYANLKKAIQYIISIHIPIVLTVFIPLALGWMYPNIFSPVHIIFLELVMGPTCSIMYENEPMEKNSMNQKPRLLTTTFFNWKELRISALQGLMIAVGSLTVYQYAVNQGFNESLTRTMVFTSIISSNIFLTLVNRSFYYSILTTLTYKNNLVFLIIGVTIVITGSLIYIRPFSKFFLFEPLTLRQLSISAGAGFLSVIWSELIKWKKRFHISVGLSKFVR